ncbi:hypothetical protein BCR44DRAFT_1446198, partial [Catenaria anguillulae PL171]
MWIPTQRIASIHSPVAVTATPPTTRTKSRMLGTRMTKWDLWVARERIFWLIRTQKTSQRAMHCLNRSFFDEVLEELGLQDAIRIVHDPLLEPATAMDTESTPSTPDAMGTFAPVRNEAEAIMHMVFNIGPHISTRWRRFLHWAIGRLRAFKGELPSLYRLSQI